MQIVGFPCGRSNVSGQFLTIFFVSLEQYYSHIAIIDTMLDVEAINEPSHEKTNNLGFRPGQTQTGLYSHRSRLAA